jgi:hypothetical protein
MENHGLREKGEPSLLFAELPRNSMLQDGNLGQGPLECLRSFTGVLRLCTGNSRRGGAALCPSHLGAVGFDLQNSQLCTMASSDVN